MLTSEFHQKIEAMRLHKTPFKVKGVEVPTDLYSDAEYAVMKKKAEWGIDNEVYSELADRYCLLLYRKRLRNT